MMKTPAWDSSLKSQDLNNSTKGKGKKKRLPAPGFDRLFWSSKVTSSMLKFGDLKIADVATVFKFEKQGLSEMPVRTVYLWFGSRSSNSVWVWLETFLVRIITVAGINHW